MRFARASQARCSEVITLVSPVLFTYSARNIVLAPISQFSKPGSTYPGSVLFTGARIRLSRCVTVRARSLLMELRYGLAPAVSFQFGCESRTRPNQPVL